MSASKPTQASPPARRPSAWQPVTFRGVAAFAQASLGRLALAQGLTALLVAAAVCTFLATTWFPTIHSSFASLPDEGTLQNGRLTLTQPAQPVLAENRFLALIVNPEAVPLPASPADLRVEWAADRIILQAGRGRLEQPYPPGRTLPFNQPELQAAWEAWLPMFFALAALGTVAFLFANWILLATLYCPVPWLIAFFKDRDLGPIGAWKLAAASLLPGALLTTAGLVLYSTATLDLPQLTLLWILHLPLAWVYLAAAPLRLPRLDPASPRRRNPFQPPRPDADQEEETPVPDPRQRSPFADPSKAARR